MNRSSIWLLNVWLIFNVFTFSGFTAPSYSPRQQPTQTEEVVLKSTREKRTAFYSIWLPLAQLKNSHLSPIAFVLTSYEQVLKVKFISYEESLFFEQLNKTAHIYYLPRSSNDHITFSQRG